MPDAATVRIDDSFPNGAFPDGPLSDVTILDLSDEATVQGARMLAELGADVVRVEDSAGDGVRSRPPYLAGPAGRPRGDEDEDVERSLAHLLFNGGKRSLALDLERRASWGVIARLLPAVDVVIGPLNLPQAGRSFFDDLRAAGGAGPAFVETIFRRGGPDGIATDHVATDLIAMAAGGHITLNGRTGEPPHYPAGQLAYRQASMTAAEAAIALLRAARIGHPGGHVVVSLQEAVNLTTLQTANANYWHWRGEVPSRHRPFSSGSAYRSRDGKWTSFTVHPPNWFKFTDWVEQTIGDTTLRGPEWEDMQYRAHHTKDAGGIVERLCAAIDQADLCREGQARGLLVMPLNDVPDLAVNEHLNARHFFHDVEDPIVDATLRLPRTPFLSDRWQTPTRRAPALGEHTSEALAGLGGLSAAEIEALFEDGIARRHAPPRGRFVAGATLASGVAHSRRRRGSPAAAGRCAGGRFHLGDRGHPLHAPAGRPRRRRDQGGVRLPHGSDSLHRRAAQRRDELRHERPVQRRQCQQARCHAEPELASGHGRRARSAGHRGCRHVQLHAGPARPSGASATRA